MKVMAVNSSPRTGGESRSELMLQHLTDGMREAGAEVEVIDLRNYKIKYCQGCYSCWTKTPGKCRHKDDMTADLYPKWLDSDIVVYSTPLYQRTFSALLKTFIERTLPASLPYLESEGGRSHHPIREKFPNFVMLSVAGFPELKEFQLLSDLARYNFNTKHSRLLAEIYRPASQALTQSVYQKTAEDIFDATKKAGIEIIEKGLVTPQILKRITQPLDEKASLLQMGNMYWQSCIDNKMTPKQFEQKGGTPTPRTIDDIKLLLPRGINKVETDKLKTQVQLKFHGQQEGSFYLDINKGKTEAYVGETDNPRLTIITPFEIWRDIMIGKADGGQMFMEGKYVIEGDADLLIKLFASDKG